MNHLVSLALKVCASSSVAAVAVLVVYVVEASEESAELVSVAMASVPPCLLSGQSAVVESVPYPGDHFQGVTHAL